MILESLVHYCETLEEKGKIKGEGWCNAKVSFALELSEKGELIQVIPLRIEEKKGNKTILSSQSLTVPQMETRSSNIAPNFLCDNSSYLLGIDKKGNAKQSIERFIASKEKHISILKDVESISARAIVQYFKTWEPEKSEENKVLAEYLEEILAEGGNLIFSINGRYAQEDAAVKKAWIDYRQSIQGEENGICLVTGKSAEIAGTHRLIQGVQGAQSSGAALVSFNAPAFESYEKKQSYNAPVSTYAVYAYTTALNYLLANKKQVSVLGDTTIVYWAEGGEEVYSNIFSAVMEPMADNQELIDGVFKSLQAGKAIVAEDVMEQISFDQKFYILGLTPNAARISVRFFYQNSFGTILEHIKKHYEQIKIVKPVMDKIEYLGIWRLLYETVNKRLKEKKPIPSMVTGIYQAILLGTPYPETLYQQVLQRIRLEQDNKDEYIYKITRGRAAIIKAFLLRNRGKDEEEVTMGLNEDCTNIAYILGREFAVLEEIQEAANPGINATIKDRYFNGACATPASIFPILFKLKNSHIRKLNNKALEIYYEKILGSLQDKLVIINGEFACPKRLSLEEQGMFILGYYHQTQKRFEKKNKEEE